MDETDGMILVAFALFFALGYIVGRKDKEQIDIKVGLSNFWNGFEMGYAARQEEELDNDE
jgi:hypothetical protein